MAVFKRGNVYWYHFSFAGKRYQETTKSKSKTLAKEAEKARRRELEGAFNNTTDNRKTRVQSISVLADAYLADYRVRHRAATFAEYAIGHVTRLLGDKLVADIDDVVVKTYQTTRLKEGAAARSINEEVTFLLRLLVEAGDALRVRMRRDKTLKLKVLQNVARAYAEDEKAKMLALAKDSGARKSGSGSLTAGSIDWSRHRETRFVLIASLSDRPRAQKAMQEGFACYIAYPFKPSAVLERLCFALGVLDGGAKVGQDTPSLTREAARPGNTRILVAEDNIVNKKMMQKLLEKRGFIVEVVGTGREAVEALSGARFDLVFMDCQMPEMDGYEAASWIRRMEGNSRHTPLIALTANAMKGDAEKCLEAGMDDYLSKPINLKELERVLQRWDQTSRAPDGNVAALH